MASNNYLHLLQRTATLYSVNMYCYFHLASR